MYPKCSPSVYDAAFGQCGRVTVARCYFDWLFGQVHFVDFLVVVAAKCVLVIAAERVNLALRRREEKRDKRTLTNLKERFCVKLSEIDFNFWIHFSWNQTQINIFSIVEKSSQIETQFSLRFSLLQFLKKFKKYP